MLNRAISCIGITSLVGGSLAGAINENKTMNARMKLAFVVANVLLQNTENTVPAISQEIDKLFRPIEKINLELLKSEIFLRLCFFYAKKINNGNSIADIKDKWHNKPGGLGSVLLNLAEVINERNGYNDETLDSNQNETFKNNTKTNEKSDNQNDILNENNINGTGSYNNTLDFSSENSFTTKSRLMNYILDREQCLNEDPENKIKANEKPGNSTSRQNENLLNNTKTNEKSDNQNDILNENNINGTGSYNNTLDFSSENSFMTKSRLMNYILDREQCLNEDPENKIKANEKSDNQNDILNENNINGTDSYNSTSRQNENLLNNTKTNEKSDNQNQRKHARRGSINGIGHYGNLLDLRSVKYPLNYTIGRRQNVMKYFKNNTKTNEKSDNQNDILNENNINGTGSYNNTLDFSSENSFMTKSRLMNYILDRGQCLNEDPKNNIKTNEKPDNSTPQGEEGSTGNERRNINTRNLIVGGIVTCVIYALSATVAYFKGWFSAEGGTDVKNKK